MSLKDREGTRCGASSRAAARRRSRSSALRAASGGRLIRALAGSLGVAVTPSDVVTAYGNIGTSFETPTTTELTNRPSGAGGFNPTLEPQKATNYEIGVRGDVRGLLNYSVALFDAEVRDELIQFPVPADANGRVFYQNAGRSRHRGVELGAELEIASGVGLTTSWTYSDFRYTRYTLGTQVLDGQALPGIPQHWLHFLLQDRKSTRLNSSHTVISYAVFCLKK